MWDTVICDRTRKVQIYSLYVTRTKCQIVHARQRMLLEKNLNEMANPIHLT